MSVARTKISVRGAVQGVGFRPFVYRLATELRLAGSVQNSPSGVDIEVQGEDALVRAFVDRLERERPAPAQIHAVQCNRVSVERANGFEIRESSAAGARTAAILPDLATCADCVREIFDPANRRYLYPFTNCTHCGPRFSIIEAVPYDRANTSMKKFTMCPECQAEYENPADRRFHAQPNACPVCGPSLELWSPVGEVIAQSANALSLAADAVRSGLVVALKGIGGFQLLADARNPAAIAALRQRKNRPEKPFAVMFPSMASVQLCCEVTEIHARLLLSPEAPIVILRRIASDLADAVAPRNPRLGVMLPYSPLHHLLMHQLPFPIVATSGNISDEPICTDEREALKRLQGVADLFLVHNRPIVRHVDDSIVQVVAGREMMIRRARGYAPLPLRLDAHCEPILAVGAHLKNSVALAFGESVFVSQHIGNLETEAAVAAFEQSATDLPKLYEAQPTVIAHDLHPDYASTQYAEASGVRAVPVQHHYAHVLACMAENHLEPQVLGVAWDGTGLGTDGTIWGGEFLLVINEGFHRVAHLRQFRLPGGDLCTKEIGRSALGMLYEMLGPAIFNLQNDAEVGRATPCAPALNAARDPLHRLFQSIPASELRLASQMLDKNLNAPLTSSAGRLFDAVAALLGLRTKCSFEGQAAMELEFNIDAEVTDAYPFTLRPASTHNICRRRREESNCRRRRQESLEYKPRHNQTPHVVFYNLNKNRAAGEQSDSTRLDWEPAVRAILKDMADGKSVGTIAAKFHNGLAEAIVQVAQRIGHKKVALSGGCFQNKCLVEQSVRRLREHGFQVFWHREIPANDGGIAVGQVMAVTRNQPPFATRSTRAHHANSANRTVETCT